MKKILFLAFISFVVNVKAQIILEHVYPGPGAGTYSSNSSQMMIINFEVSGEKYVNVNRVSKSIKIYGMNHSLEKNISLAALPFGIGSGQIDDILYLSQHLFNLDTMIEFMYCTADAPTQNITRIYDETGAVLFSGDSISIPIKVNIPLQQYPIYNTSYGTKMILSPWNGDAKVYSLAGTLSTAIQEANQHLVQGGMLSNPRPNPTDNTTTIDYKMPGGVNQGEIVFYDLQGMQIKRFKVDNTFTSLLISTTDVSAGTYYYQLQTIGNVSSGKKMVVVK